MLTRRELIGRGGAAGLLAAMPCAATARPQDRVPAGLLARARAAAERLRPDLRDLDVIAIADFAQPSRADRFHLLRTADGTVTSYQVAHGRGSDPLHTGYLGFFFNTFGSEASSAGAYVTGDVYYGRYGRSLRLKGMDPSNSNAELRAIVVHAAAYAEPAMVTRHGKLGRSEGCFALSQLSLQYVLQQLGPGRLLYCDRLPPTGWGSGA